MLADVLFDRTRMALFHAGWTPSHAFSVDSAAKAHGARGIELHNAASEFLRAFGGLVVRGRFGAAILETDPEAALAALSDEELEGLSDWVGEPLAVVGRAQSGRSVLLMSPAGTLYVLKGLLVVSYGTDLAEALDRLCDDGSARERLLN